MRKKIYDMIEVSQDSHYVRSTYDLMMLVAIIISIIPLAFKQTNTLFIIMDVSTVIIFIIDYILRLITADYLLKTRRKWAFLVYPFTFWALIDLISILPTLTALNSGFKLFKLLRIIKTFRVFKALRYSRKVRIASMVLKKSRNALLVVMSLTIGYILVAALIVFNVEPDTFNNFFDAAYWATVSLTTVGYGDIYPVTTAGRVVTIISSIMGIIIIALPSGVITAGYMEVVKEEKEYINDNNINFFNK